MVRSIPIGGLPGVCRIAKAFGPADASAATRFARCVGAAWLVAATLGSAPPSGSAAELKFGMVTALSGPAADMGLGVKSGVDAAFAEANAAGGVRSHALRLIALDDGYDPVRTGPQMRSLIDEHEVLALIGNLGTPTAVVALPLASQSRVLMFGSISGASLLRRSPPERYAIHYRASYGEETTCIISALVDEAGLKPEEFAFFTQRDSYGDAGFSEGRAALVARGLPPYADILHVRYERNTDAVENALAELLEADPPPRVVVMAGSHKATAKFVRLARVYGLEAVFASLSFVGAEALQRELGQDCEGVIVTQVTPPPDSAWPMMSRFRAALAAYDSEVEPTYAALEGYLAAQLLVRGLGNISGEVSREKLVEAMESLGEIDLGLGFPLLLTTDEHQASHRVWPTIHRAGRFVPLDRSTFPRLAR